MKKILTFTLVGASLLTSLNLQAYDVDTHFYGTYTMARFAGIRHEVAAKIAASTQWMDESYISDPLSMIVLPATGIKKRRLLHFPGKRLANAMTINTLKASIPNGVPFIDPSTGADLKAVTETIADDPFATEMFTEGLKEGNIYKAGAGLHTLEDSFAHAGTIAELGHAHFWHHPDRPYVDEASVQKYFKMCLSVLRAMVAIRTLLPANAIDMSYTYSPEKGPNYLLNGDQLADIYTQIPEVVAAVSRKILNDPSYVQFALKYLFKRAQEVQYVNDGYQNYLNNFKPGQDTYDAASSVTQSIVLDQKAKALPNEIINVAKIMKATGHPENPREDYIEVMGGQLKLIGSVMVDLFENFVPRPMNSYHKFEKEEDGPLWMKELDMRTTNMQGLIWKLFGDSVQFVPNHTASEEGYLLELSNDPKANRQVPLSNGTTKFVTFNLEEKRHFNRMIFKFVLPHISNHFESRGDLKTLEKLAFLVIKKEQKFGDVKGAVATLKYAWGAAGSFVSGLWDGQNILKLAEEDLLKTRLSAQEENRYYVVPTVLRKYIENKTFKPLLTNQQMDGILAEK